MRNVRSSLLAVALVMAVWAVFSWPLPLHFGDGIPASSCNQDKGHVRAMILGDHLQLRYHFWLLSDAIRGLSPWMSNIYEFNEGSDAARRVFTACFLPYSLVYAAGERLGGAAAGWNLAGLAALLATYGFTWALARRYAPNGWTAAAAAVVSITLPYRWVMALGGSPSGYGMSLVPLCFLGMDRVVRDEDWRGGLLAGVALLLVYWSDLQAFFFTALTLPLWGLIALSAKDRLEWRSPRLWGRWTASAVAMVPGCLAILIFALSFKSRLAGSEMQGGRPLTDVLLYSPIRRGMVSYTLTGAASHVFVGWVLMAVLGIGLAVLARRAWKGTADDRRRLAVFLLIAAGCAAVFELALGPNGWRGGRLFQLARAVVPTYDMVRQPAKILAVAPTFLAVALALALGSFRRPSIGGVWRGAAVAGCVALVAVEHRVVVNATVCLLDREQGAYAAVAADAARRGVAPRVLVLPLWPGDSAWSSIYEHYVSLYRIRMVNGYAPMLKKTYIESVYRRLDTANQGYLEESQFADLRRMGVDYVLLHEAAYPEQVSPFPVGFALARLRANPRLELLRQAESVWAFRVLDAPRALAAEQRAVPTALLTARRWEAERVPSTNVAVRAQPGASGGRVAVLAGTDSAIETATRSRVAPVQGLRWMARVRGEGAVSGEVRVDGLAAGRRTETLSGAEWTWREWPVGPGTGSAVQGFSLRRESGSVEVDTILLAAGDLIRPRDCRSVSLPASLCFHAGHTTADGGVKLDPRRDPEGDIVYASNLLLEPGEYELAVTTVSDSTVNRKLGELRVRGEDVKGGPAPVWSGQTVTALRFAKTGNLPFRIAFAFAREADVEVREFRVRQR